LTTVTTTRNAKLRMKRLAYDFSRVISAKYMGRGNRALDSLIFPNNDVVVVSDNPKFYIILEENKSEQKVVSIFRFKLLNVTSSPKKTIQNKTKIGIYLHPRFKIEIDKTERLNRIEKLFVSKLLSNKIRSHVAKRNDILVIKTDYGKAEVGKIMLNNKVEIGDKNGINKVKT